MSLSGLIQDPLEIANFKQIRDSSSQFKRPTLLSFDAFNTLYYPKTPVYDQYHEIASSEFGIVKLATLIKQDFPKIYSSLLAKYPNYGKVDGLESSDLWWKELIVELFGLDHYSKNPRSDALCERLIQHFNGSEAYAVFDDVIPVFKKLQENGVRLVVSSNSDPRVLSILSSLGLNEYLSNVFLSYELGHAKPKKLFYDAVVSNYHDLAPSKGALLESAWHIGDDYEKDFIGSIRSGWNGVLLDREGTSEFFRNKTISQVPQSDCFMSDQEHAARSQDVAKNDNLLILADNRVVISNLYQLLTIFEFE